MLNETLTALKLARAMAPTTIGRPSSVAVAEAQYQAAQEAATVMPIVGGTLAVLVGSVGAYLLLRR
ncbi:MAG: hypothetical protein ACLQBL_03845 [Polyangiaceae bacterium]